MGTRRKGPAQRKEQEIRFRGSRLDSDRLAALAKHYEVTGSEVLRRLLKEESERVDAVKRGSTK